MVDRRVEASSCSFSWRRPCCCESCSLLVRFLIPTRCELEVHTDELHRVDRWLTEEDGALDGVYLQFEKKMLTKEGAAYLRKLSERLTVGVWNYAERDPDDYDTFHWLVKEGNCTFVNTDLPKNFRNEILFQNQQRAASHSPPRGAV